jgi:enhancing lycopene biosynthesis protein 2
MKKKIAIILAGSGVFDGSEIHEATMAMYALSKHDLSFMCFAPDIQQAHVINHLNGEEMPETRNVLIESARLARGKVDDIRNLKADDFDGLLFPGGFGAAKNLSDFAFKGDQMTVLNSVEKIIKDFHSKRKPIAALCIAPTIIAKVLGAKVTIGKDPETAKAIVNMGGIHENIDSTGVSIDNENKIVTNPCYMLASNVFEVGQGAEAAVIALKELM